MSSAIAHFHFFLALPFFILSASAAPPPLYNLSSSRVAVYDDINSEFRLVYSVSPVCPQIVAFGDPTMDARKVAVLPMSSINEDGTLCTGPSAINFLGEANLRGQDDLQGLQLGGMRDALENNPSAKNLIGTDGPASLLVGWHDGERTCNDKVYPRDTIYFIINEDNGKTISLKKPTQRDVVRIPPLMRALLIVAPQSIICLLVDPSSNANDDVTVTVVPDDGSPPTTTSATPAGSSTSSAPSVAPPAPTPATSTAIPAVSTPAASSVPPATSPVPIASGGPTPTASPVAPVSSAPVPTPVTSLAPSAAAANGSAISPDETPAEVVVPSPEEDILDEGTTPSAADDGSACFPAGSLVKLESGRVKKMVELEVGDRVLTDAGFSDVILFTHRDGKSRNAFLRVTVADSESLIVSPGHYVYSNERRLKAARSLGKGDVLHKSNGEQAVIVSVERVSAVGLFNPQTTQGSIVVNGFVASTYTTTVDPFIAHSVLMVPVRWIYGFSPRLAEIISSLFNHGSPLLAALLPKGASVTGLL